MTKRQVVTYSYTCDVGGEEFPDNDDGGTRKISWEGSDYIVDVCSSHDGELSEILGRLKAFVDAGQRQDGRRGRRGGTGPAIGGPRKRRVATAKSASSAKPRSDLSAVRTWARENGHSVNGRGRIPAAVMAAYEEAQKPAEPALPAEPAAAPKKRAARSPRKTASV